MFCRNFSRPLPRPIIFTLYFSKPYSEALKNFGRLNIHQRITQQNKVQKRFYIKEKKISLNSSSKGLAERYRSVSQDICIYTNDNSKFFKYLSLFSVSQFIFWSYLSYTSYTTMRNIPVTEEEYEKVRKLRQQGELKFVSIWRQLNLGRYKNVISSFSAIVGKKPKFYSQCIINFFCVRLT